MRWRGPARETGGSDGKGALGGVDSVAQVLDSRPMRFVVDRDGRGRDLEEAVYAERPAPVVDIWELDDDDGNGRDWKYPTASSMLLVLVLLLHPALLLSGAGCLAALPKSSPSPNIPSSVPIGPRLVFVLSSKALILKSSKPYVANASVSTGSSASPSSVETVEADDDA